jgi:glycosyltransferase involved in cell wall biosynthesis
MRILLTNIWLKGRTGTEVVTIEMASGLARRGHEVAVFSPELGTSAGSLRKAGIPVTDCLNKLTFSPDVIHGNHSVDLVHGFIRFPNVPGIFVCHNSDHWICSPPDLFQIRSYLSVDRLGRERIMRELPRARDNVKIIHNAVDLDRFRPREALPARPVRALALTKFSQHLPILEEACQKAGLQMDEIGSGAGLEVDDLPHRLCHGTHGAGSHGRRMFRDSC